MVMSYLKPFHQLGKLVGHVVRAGTMSKTVRWRDLIAALWFL
jgi:hypothetical protein